MEFSCWCLGWLLSNSLSKLLKKIIYWNKLFKINLLKSVVYSIIYFQFLFHKIHIEMKYLFPPSVNKNFSGDPFQWRFPFKWRIVHWLFLIVSACYQVTFYLTKDTFIWKTEIEIIHAMSELEKKIFSLIFIILG